MHSGANLNEQLASIIIEIFSPTVHESPSHKRFWPSLLKVNVNNQAMIIGKKKQKRCQPSYC
jgi:hypothetical protein